LLSALSLKACISDGKRGGISDCGTANLHIWKCSTNAERLVLEQQLFQQHGLQEKPQILILTTEILLSRTIMMVINLKRVLRSRISGLVSDLKVQLWIFSITELVVHHNGNSRIR